MPVKDTQQELAFQDKEIEVFELNKQADPFAGNHALSAAYRKAERVALAVHLVTNTAPDSAVVKNALRNTSQEILLHILSLPQGFLNTTTPAFVTLVAHVRSVLSLMDLAHIEGYVSLAHLQLIKRAYLDTLTFLSTSVHEGSAHATKLSTEDLSTAPIHKGQHQTHKGHIKDTENINDIRDIQPQNGNKKDFTKKRETPLAQRKEVGNRRIAILDILSIKPQASLQDITKKLSHIGSKTIQRELAQLVEDGVITKAGERRWTTYAINGA